jgi:hypothetical protein
MLPAAEAVRRARVCLETALDELPHDHGILPHSLDSERLAPLGTDAFSTVDASWLIAGGLWAAAFLGDGGLERLAVRPH